VPVVQPGAAYSVLIDAKAQLSNQVQRAQGGRAQPRDIACIRRDFGFN